MTDEEKQVAQALARCRFAPATWDKRFARDIAHMNLITERQAEMLRKTAYRYRRTLGDKWIEIREKC